MLFGSSVDIWQAALSLWILCAGRYRLPATSVGGRCSATTWFTSTASPSSRCATTPVTPKTSRPWPGSCPTPSAAAPTTGPASTSSSTWGTASLPCRWPGRCGRRCPSRRSEAARAEPGAPSCGRRGRIGRPDGPYGMVRRPIRA